MVSVTDLPVLVYLNEPFVNQQTQILEEGEVEHIVEEFGESEEESNRGGLNIYQVLKLEREKTTGSTESTARKIRRTPIGNFAVYHGLLENSDELEDLTDLDARGREELDDAGFVTVSGSIRRNALGEYNHFMEKHQLYEDVVDRNDPNDQRTLSYMKEASTYFEIPMQDLDGCFVFKLDEEYFLDVEPGFPDQHREYTVVGEIRHVYLSGEKKHYMDVLNVGSGSGRSREERVKQRRRFKKMASSSEKLLGRPVTEEDYHISHPDIRVDPIAIYR